MTDLTVDPGDDGTITYIHMCSNVLSFCRKKAAKRRNYDVQASIPDEA